MRGPGKSFTAGANGFFFFLLSVQVVQGQNGWGVTYNSTKVCALKGSTVDIGCSYFYPATVNRVETTVWLTRHRHSYSVDLKEELQYADRVQYLCEGRRDCTLRITDLRESDSAEYMFRFTTNLPEGKYTGSPGVTLTVADLTVQVTREQRWYSYSNRAELKCHHLCQLSPRPTYIWYKNGKYMKEATSLTYVTNVDYKDSFACALKTHKVLLSSPPVCVWEQTCGSVIYTNTELCVLKGSSVDISCTYKTYYRYLPVQSTFWFRPEHGNVHSSQPEDLSGDSQYTGRVQYPAVGDGRSVLRIRDLRESDSAEYRFIFKTRYFEWGMDLPGTTLTVTGLKLKVTPLPTVTETQRVTLTCSTCCPLTAKPSFIWSHNGQVLTQAETKQNQLVFESVGSQHAGTYSCAVKDHPDLSSPEETLTVTYGPRTSSVVMSPADDIKEGDLVTLTCSSDANPPAQYTWYKENQTLPCRRGDTYQLPSIRYEDSGIYRCQSENKYGHLNSAPQVIDVQYAPKVPSVSVSPSGEFKEGSSVTLTCKSDANPPVDDYIWFKENEDSPTTSGQNYTINNITTDHSGNYVCQVRNRRGRNNSTNQPIVVKGTLMSTAAVWIPTFLVAIILLSVFIWIRRKRASKHQAEPNFRKTSDNVGQLNSGPLYENISAGAESLAPAAERELVGQQDNPLYTSVHFAHSKNKKVPLDSTIKQPQPQNQEDVVYSVVKPNAAFQ
ncbi:B-cell receptor CD22-like [Lampris incognitus]|uniref:B-cell receptor CD22-like n=1 Tax=Lampris incognitus TaxID=2546036 RepID=UPI0024B62B02|nr:B-cell receptor CD22-like [Lampris incognitus]